MLTSNADVFRARQAVRDLKEAARLHRDAIASLGATGAETKALESLVDGSCKLPSQDPHRLYSNILLSAALPEADFDAFIAATALLLANRIQGGAGEDDLYWNWEAFADHYCLAAPPVRAAVLNGFRFLHDFGFIRLKSRPSVHACLTRLQQDVVAGLKAAGNEPFASIISDDVPADVAGRLWDAQNGKELSLEIGAGFRYLYERPQSMAPHHPVTCPLIPWV